MYGPCLSPILGEHALTPPTRRSLGRPLPYQQADRPQAPPSVGSYALLPYGVMRYYPRFRGTIPHQRVDSYVLLSRSRLPVLRRIVPLACLRHAASVRPGPGSNPQIVTSLYPMRKNTLQSSSSYASSHILNVKVLSFFKRKNRPEGGCQKWILPSGVYIVLSNRVSPGTRHIITQP